MLNLLLAPDINLTLNSSLITSNECQNMKPIHFQVQTVASKFGKQSLIVNKFPDQDCQSHSTQFVVRVFDCQAENSLLSLPHRRV